MWSPTHIQVTVQRAKGLLTKGKNGTNNCFVTIGLGKEKYQTSVKDKAESNVSWNEECELKIPDQGNRAELVLTCLHRNNLGIDEFLGQATLPLNEMDVYDRPRSKWFKLESKPGKEKKNKERGELEARITFVVKSGSLTDLSKKDKHKSSIGQLATSVGGSLLSIGTFEKRKGIKKFAKSIGSKMHLSSSGKKKNKDGDDASFNGSFASIDTPNSSLAGSRRYGQRAGEADPGVISEDEDEFVFDNLSHKSSGSSLNIRSGLHQAPPSHNFVPHQPSPLLGNGIGKASGKKLPKDNIEDDYIIDPEEAAVAAEIENEFSLRARTLPPPSKPPRTPQLGTDVVTPPKHDEWETKLYGKHDSLKRSSWGPAPIPLPTANEEEREINSITNSDRISSSSSSSYSDEEIQEIPLPTVTETASQAQELLIDTLSKVSAPPQAALQPQINLISPDVEKKNDFNEFNATFAKFEQQNGAKLFDFDADMKTNSQAFIAQESQMSEKPQAMPRNRDLEVSAQKAAEAEEIKLEIERERKAEEERLRRAKEEEEAAQRRLNEEEQRQREKEQALKLKAEAAAEEEKRQAAERQQQKQKELEKQQQQQKEEEEEEKRLETKRREEDQRILNFAKRSMSIENGDQSLITSQESPKEQVAEKREKRIGKFKYFNKRDKNEDVNSTPSPKSNERIIIGHERSTTHAERRSEISAALAKKYDGKSREELMLIANGMENEALLQRQRVKELEDYLDNLLLRVMETHPKILQNPYSRTTSAKSG